MGLSMIYILPMILGRTFDIRTNRVGIDIFPPDQLAMQEIDVAPLYDSSYKMVTNSLDVQSVLDVSGDLALKVKAGNVDIKGAGAYLKNSGSTDNTVEVLTKMKFYTSTAHLSLKAKPYPEWTNHRREDLGTHYVQSVTYGGELIASLKFVAHKEEYLQDITAQVSANIKGVQLESLVASGKLAKLKKDLQDKANMEITYFATVPLKGVPNTLEGLQMLVEGFKDHVKSVNNGVGVPVRVGLIELSTLDNRFTFLMNEPLKNALKTFESQFDDLRKAKSKMIEWIKNLPPTLTDKQEEQINGLYVRVNTVLRSFHDTIGKLDVQKGPEQLEDSKNAYREKGSSLPGKFTREFEKMKMNMKVKEIESSDFGKSVYTRWGSDTCNETTSKHVFTGYVASSSEMGVGGGSGYLCLPKDPNLGEKLEVRPIAGSFVSGVNYGLTESAIFDGKDDLYGNGVFCSVCHIGTRSSVVTKSASQECPDEWVMEYSGYMAASKDTGHRASYVCLDKHPRHYLPSNPRNTDQNLYLVGRRGGDDHVIIPCVVCSK